ncbi:unnamed protein product [Arctogadus glacialis]
MLPARQSTWKRVFVGTQLSLKTLRPHFTSEEDCNAFRDRSTHRNATSESLGVDAPGSSHMSSHSEELKILSVYGKGEGPLATDGHDALFTASEVEALNSLSADHSAAKSLERGERLVCREELSVQQQTPDTISIKVEEDIGGGSPSVEYCDAFGDRSTQRGATSESLGVDGPGSSHMSSRSEELKILSVYGKGEGPLAEDGHDTLFTASEVEALNSLSADHSAAKSLERGERLVCREELSVQQTPDTISIKVEEDIGGGSPSVEYCDAFGDRSTQRGATSESLGVDGPGSSHMSSHSGELKILSVYGKGEGPLAVDGHDTLFTASEVEALNSLSADHSVAKSLERGERLVCHEELSVQQTPDTISIKVEEDIGGDMSGEVCDAFGDRSTQRGATSESLGVDAPGSSHMSSHSEELKFLSVYVKREDPLATDGHDTLFTASEVEALNSLSADHSAAKSLERGKRLVRREELSVQQTPDTISIKVEEDIGGGMPAVDGSDIRDRSTQRGATSESLRVDAPGSSHMSSHSGELRSLNCSVRLVRLEELTGYRGGRKGRPGVLCGKVIPNNANMIVHMRNHADEKPYRCDQCMRHFKWQCSLTVHMRTHSGEKPYKCDQCTKRFGLRGHLNTHMRIHSGEKPYKCDRCTKRYRKKCHLKRHMMTHSGERPYKCDQCKKRFSRKGNLKIHMRIHSGEKPYKCDQCTKGYRQQCELKNHMMTHSDEKPYKCDQCRMSFSVTRDLKLHMMTHSGENPYECDQCTKQFFSKNQLMIHVRTHSDERPYMCDQCTTRFGEKSKLKRHMKTHRREKPYKCDQCTKRFSLETDLKIHMRTHSVDKLYKCDQCTKRYSQCSALKTHMRTHPC